MIDVTNLEDPTCTECGSGFALFIGILGQRAWFKCRACGWIFSIKEAVAEVAEETENEEYYKEED